MHNIRQIILSNLLLLYAQFNYAVGHLAHGLLVKFNTHGHKVHLDIGLAAVLAQSILTHATEPLRQQGVEIEIVLLIAVGMHAGTLREHKLTHHRHVVRNMYAAVQLHLTAHLEQAALIEPRLHAHLVLEHGQHAAQRCIAGPLAQTVHRHVHALDTGLDSRIDIGHSQVIVIMCVEIKMY